MIAVRARGVGKKFKRTLPRFDTLLGRLRGRVLDDELWALRDVTFEVERGECFGIQGPNGAGKSTLLALAAGILQPSEGVLEVRGKANALLGLHAALHPELSVLENIDICGVLMGLRRGEVAKRRDAILDFSGQTRSAEVRMAELSAGQVQRVAFACAVHADLDVMLVDEALSVGDEEFQSKCVETFARLRREGTTILAASHDLPLLERIADRRLLLSGGRGEVVGAPPAKRVLFIGNSLTAAGEADVPKMLAAMGANVEAVVVEKESLSGHWERGAATRTIRERRWDFVVLQEESARSVGDYDAMRKYARLFDSEIKAAGARTVLLSPWAKRGGDQAEIDAAYSRLSADLEAPVAAAGSAWRDEWYAPDGDHANPDGAQAAARAVADVVLKA